VRNLDPLYRRAGVVISPLTVGSGLKIKLIEALSRGKAIVATPISLQGVEALLSPVVSVAGAAGDFGSAVVGLLRDEDLRAQMGRAALKAATTYFSSDACYAELVGYVRQFVNRE